MRRQGPARRRGASGRCTARYRRRAANCSWHCSRASHTRPLELRVPSSTEGSLARTRFNTLLAAEAWLKRVVSFAAMEKLFQLMMAPLVFLTVNRFPAWLKLAAPLTTWGPTGLAHAGAVLKQ